MGMRSLDRNPNQESKQGNGGNLLSTYNRFKHSFDIEPYLGCRKLLRSSLTRLRVAACNLQINLGRRHRALHLPVDCNCDFCMSATNTTFVEYEHHFIMQYPFPVKNRVFQWLFIFDTHKDITENVEIYTHDF